MKLHENTKTFKTGRSVSIARKLNDMSQGELAEKVGCSRIKISRIENSEDIQNFITIEFMKRLTDALLTDDLLSDEEY